MAQACMKGIYRCQIGRLVKRMFAIAIVVPICALAQGVLHKCVTKNGDTAYSQMPCPSENLRSATTLAAPKAPSPDRKQPPLVPTMSREAQLYEEDRAKRIAERQGRQNAVDSAADRVRQLKTANHDPKKCEAIQAAMDARSRRDPIGAGSSVEMAELRGQANLYCGP